jgi:hypothetical protein
MSARHVPVWGFGPYLMAAHGAPFDPREQTVIDPYRATLASIAHAIEAAAKERAEVDSQSADYMARRQEMVNALEGFCKVFGYQVVDFELRHIARTERP